MTICIYLNIYISSYYFIVLHNLSEKQTFLCSGYYKKNNNSHTIYLFCGHFLICKASPIKLQMLLQFCLVCGLRICLTASIPFTKSCTVSDINLLFLRLKSYFLQFKRKCSSDSIVSGQKGQNRFCLTKSSFFPQTFLVWYCLTFHQ